MHGTDLLRVGYTSTISVAGDRERSGNRFDLCGVLAPAFPPAAAAGWVFAEEYYDQRRWLAAGAAPVGSCPREGPRRADYRARHSGTHVDPPWATTTASAYVCGSFEPNEFAFLDGC